MRDLKGVSRADGGNGVGQHQGALHQVDAAVKLQAGNREPGLVDAQQREEVAFANALERKVMKGAEAGSRSKLRANRRVCADHYWRHRRVPIVRMEYVRMQHRRGLGGRPPKEDETPEIVRVVTIF